MSPSFRLRPPASTPTISTFASSIIGAKMPAALDPPPTQAITMSGSRPSAASICLRASRPMGLWNSRTIVGYGCGPATEPMM